jgi:hypothetical protein
MVAAAEVVPRKRHRPNCEHSHESDNEGVADLADGVITLLQHLEDATAGPVAERFAEEVQQSGIQTNV